MRGRASIFNTAGSPAGLGLYVAAAPITTSALRRVFRRLFSKPAHKKSPRKFPGTLCIEKNKMLIFSFRKCLQRHFPGAKHG